MKSESAHDPNALLNDLLREHRASEFVLPNLAKEKGWFEEQFQKWVDWINSLFHFGSFHLDLNYDRTWYILKIIFAVALTLLVLYLVYRLYRATSQKEDWRPTETSDQADNSFRGEKEFFETQIDAALRTGHFARAARLRWKLFLVRTAQPDSQTPLEHFRAPDSVEPAYRLMFHLAAEEAATGYARWDEQLKALEN